MSIPFRFSLTSFFVLLVLSQCFAQRKPLLPDGNTQTMNLPLRDFESLELLWLDGRIDIEFGADSNSLQILADANIMRLIRVDNTNNTLKIEVDGNAQNRLWLEDDKTTLKIRSRSQPASIEYKCNANATLRGLSAKTLALEHDMNGNLEMSGTADSLVVRKDNNGALYASGLQVGVADVVIDGNGDVQLNARRFVRRESAGNGGIANAGETASAPGPAIPRVKVSFYNNRAKKGDFYVTGINEAGKKFSYGLSLGAFAKQSEYLPVGTRVYQNDRFGKLLTTLGEKDDNQIVRLY